MKLLQFMNITGIDQSRKLRYKMKYPKYQDDLEDIQAESINKSIDTIIIGLIIILTVIIALLLLLSK
jgi:hypothetical protein